MYGMAGVPLVEKTSIVNTRKLLRKFCHAPLLYKSCFSMVGQFTYCCFVRGVSLMACPILCTVGTFRQRLWNQWVSCLLLYHGCFDMTMLYYSFFFFFFIKNNSVLL